MTKEELDNWFIKGKMFSISLLNYYVDICYIKNSDEFILRVTDNNMNKYYYQFDNYEDALEFSYGVIDKTNTIEEIELSYLALKEVKKQIK